jgi:uncharacterized membrane protein (DUF4010 family)
MEALGGLYSSTATTVVLAREAKTGAVTRQHAQAGITLATAIMYLRILVVVAFFNFGLARVLAPWLCCLSLAGLVICAVQYRLGKAPIADKRAEPSNTQRFATNPLELGPAAIFAALFIVVSLVSNWAKAEFGTSGIYSLAAIVGVTDIDPFVLNLAQGGTTGLSESALAAAILIAASSKRSTPRSLPAGARPRQAPSSWCCSPSWEWSLPCCSPVSSRESNRDQASADDLIAL